MNVHADRKSGFVRWMNRDHTGPFRETDCRIPREFLFDLTDDIQSYPATACRSAASGAPSLGRFASDAPRAARGLHLAMPPFRGTRTELGQLVNGPATGTSKVKTLLECRDTGLIIADGIERYRGTVMRVGDDASRLGPALSAGIGGNGVDAMSDQPSVKVKRLEMSIQHLQSPCIMMPRFSFERLPKQCPRLSPALFLDQCLAAHDWFCRPNDPRSSAAPRDCSNG